MKWMSLFAQNENITPEETRKLIELTAPDTFQLLDVRQPKEYDEAHIPGAILIPLGELPARLHELKPDKETIVYCRSGVRSRAGCQILSAAQFSRVLNMTGGINGWHGNRALGPETRGLDFFITGDYASALAMAYAMEEGLHQFYQFLADRADTDENCELLEYMARLEDGHMAKLRGQNPSLQDSMGAPAGIIEGGFASADLIATFGDQLRDVQSILQTGMMFEAQAYDMYNRLARQEEKAELRNFYLQMAGEEQRHLARLAQELDKRLT